MPLRMLETVEEEAFSAVKVGDIPNLERLLDAGLNVNHVFISTRDVKAHGMTLLHIAVSENNAPLVRFLVRKGCDINRANHCKSFDGTRSRVRPVRYKDRLHLTCLFHAICSQNEEIISMLITGGADVNFYDRSGSSALWHGVDTNNSRITAAILTAPGCDVNLPDAFKMAPLHVAAVHKNPVVIRQLLEQGALVDPQQLQGATPLYIASRTSSTESIRLLLQHGADPNIYDSEGISPLHIALDRSGSSELVYILINAGAYVYSRHVFVLQKEFDILKSDQGLRAYITDILDSPPSLKILAALRTKKTLIKITRGKSILHLVRRLPLPKVLIKYILLE